MEETNFVFAEVGTVTIPLAEYWGLLRAQRDLELLKKSYCDNPYGVDSAVEKTILGPKPEPKPEPEPNQNEVAELVKQALDNANRAVALLSKDTVTPDA